MYLQNFSLHDSICLALNETHHDLRYYTLRKLSHDVRGRQFVLDLAEHWEEQPGLRLTFEQVTFLHHQEPVQCTRGVASTDDPILGVYWVGRPNTDAVTTGAYAMEMPYIRLDAPDSHTGHHLYFDMLSGRAIRVGAAYVHCALIPLE